MFNKTKHAAISFVMILLLTGCAAKDDLADYSAYDYPLVENISAKTQLTEYDGNVETIWVYLTNDRDEDFSYDYQWTVEKEIDGEWRAIRFIQDISFDLADRSIPSRCTTDIPCDLKNNVKQPLLPGHYRIWVGGEENRVPAEFTIIE